MMRLIHPYIRAFFSLFSFVGTILSNNILLQILFLGLLIFVLIYKQIIRHYLIFLISFIIPLTLVFIFFYSLLIPLLSNTLTLNSIIKNLFFPLLIGTRLSVIMAIFQITLNMETPEFLRTFKKWRASEEFTLSFLGGVSIWTDVRRKAQKITDAIYAKGLIKKRSYIYIMPKLPIIIRPLIIILIQDAIERGELWQERSIKSRVVNLELTTENYPFLFNFLLLVLSLFWLLMNINASM